MREYLLVNHGSIQSQKLHLQSAKYVCAPAQAKVYDIIADSLTEEEAAVMKRGRNATSHSTPKGATPIEYRKATGVETLIGFLKLSNRIDRLYKVMELCVNITENSVTE